MISVPVTYAPSIQRVDGGEAENKDSEEAVVTSYYKVRSKLDIASHIYDLYPNT